MSRPTPDRPEGDEELTSRLVSEAGDPTVEPRPEHVADLRALIHDRLGPPLVNRRMRARWLVVSGLAAACLLTVLAWPRSNRKDSVPGSSRPQSSDESASRPRQGAAGIAAWRNVRGSLEVSEIPAFSWPLQGSSPHPALTSLPPDLLD